MGGRFKHKLIVKSLLNFNEIRYFLICEILIIVIECVIQHILPISSYNYNINL